MVRRCQTDKRQRRERVNCCASVAFQSICTVRTKRGDTLEHRSGLVTQKVALLYGTMTSSSANISSADHYRDDPVPRVVVVNATPMTLYIGFCVWLLLSVKYRFLSRTWSWHSLASRWLLSPRALERSRAQIGRATTISTSSWCSGPVTSHILHCRP